ncbi:MAG: DUF2807 domain-containing protein [Pseudomonadota bacterium]
MNKMWASAIMGLALCGVAGAAAAGSSVTETRVIDARVVRIKLDGVINLHLKQGATPSLLLIGDKKAIDKVTTVQSGDTLQIDLQNRQFFHFGHDNQNVRAELTLPSLQEFISRGVGEADVSGFGGDSVRLELDGAGAVTVNSHYKNMDARLSGVGSMKINAGDSERVDLRLGGAGEIVISGQSKVLHAKLGGVGSLDAQHLRAEAVDLNISGVGGATVFASNSADLKLSGLGSATVYGKPAKRNTDKSGLGGISWE